MKMIGRLVLLALVAAAGCSSSQDPPETSAPVGSTPSTGRGGGTGSTSTGSSGEGRIVFSADDGTGYDLYTIEPSGEGMTRLTETAGTDELNADWSPDGAQLVYEVASPSGVCSVFLASADGSDAIDLTAANPDGVSGCDSQPAFTPDGASIVFVHSDPDTGVESIWSMNLDGADRTEITDGIGRGLTDPNVSPDGKRLSFIEFNGEELGQALAVANLDGSGVEELTAFEDDVAVKHDWAPSGDELVVTVNADNLDLPANVATIAADGGRLRLVTDLVEASERAYVGGYSPDGDWIVFRLEDGDQAALVRIRPDGSGQEDIVPMGDLRPRFIDWGPASAG